jgi:hypothetical protein
LTLGKRSDLRHHCRMKKLAISLAALTSLTLAAPAFACPGMDHDSPSNTAEAAPKKDTAKPADKAEKPTDTKTAKPTEKAAPKKGDKVSMK